MIVMLRATARWWSIPESPPQDWLDTGRQAERKVRNVFMAFDSPAQQNFAADK